MRVAVAVAHAAFDIQRRDGLQRIEDTLKTAVHVSRSDRPEPSHVWARRLWAWAAGQSAEADRIVMLNDDVAVCPDLVAAVAAMPHMHVCSLHCSLPVAQSLAECGVRWCRSYWLTGPGYWMTPAAAAMALRWWQSQTMARWDQSINEDVAAIHWAYSLSKPIPQCIPALVEHDVSYPSMLGYDNHSLRQTNVAWQRYPELDTTCWPNGNGALCIENPWARTPELEMAARALRAGISPGKCWLCTRRPGVRGSQLTGAMVCRACVSETVHSLIGQ